MKSVIAFCFCLMLLLFGGSAWGADELQRGGREPFVFTSGDKGILLVFAKKTVKVFPAEILWLSDQTNGRAADISTLTIVPREEKTLQAGDFVRLQIETKTGFDKRRTFDGQIGIRYEVVPDSGPALQREMLTWTFVLLGEGVSGLPDAKNASLDFVTSTGTPAVSKLPIGPGSTFGVCLLAKIAGVSVIESKVGVVDLFDSTNNVPLDPLAVSVVKVPTKISLEEPACVELKQGVFSGAPVKVTGTLVVPYRAPSATVEVKKAFWNFELSRPPVSVSVGLNGAFTISGVREWPLSDQPVHRCVPYTITPPQAKLDTNKQLQAEIYADGVRPDYLDRATIAAKPGENRDICIDATIPGGLTTLKAKIRIVPPDVMQAVELSSVFQIKDRVHWRLLTALLAYCLAFLIYFLTTGLRTRLEHRATRASISLRLARFLATNPSYTDHDAVVFVRQLLFDSEQQDRQADFDIATNTLTSADSRMTQLETPPLPPPSPVDAPTALEIRVLDPPDRMISGRTISFRVGNPPAQWTAGSVYQWKVGPSETSMKDVGSSTNQTSMKHFFPSNKIATNWIIEVSANGVSKSRTIALAADNSGLSQWLASLNLLPQLLAMLMATLAAYVATNSAESWGTSNDYANLFLAAFGVSGGTQSFAVLLQALRR